MIIAEWCLLAAVILYLMTVAPVKAFGFREFDNASPRDPTFYKPGLRARALGARTNGIETFPFFAVAVLLKPGLRARALGARTNGIETFPFFAVAVLLAEMRSCPQDRIDMLALLFVALRVFYVLAYLGNAPATRTLLWNAAFIVNTAIFLLPLFAR